MRVRRDPTRVLTPRELDSLRALVETGSVASAADALGIAPQTMKNHLRDAYRRLDVNGAVQAIALLDDRWPGWRPRARRQVA